MAAKLSGNRRDLGIRVPLIQYPHDSRTELGRSAALGTLGRNFRLFSTDHKDRSIKIHVPYVMGRVHIDATCTVTRCDTRVIGFSPLSV